MMTEENAEPNVSDDKKAIKAALIELANLRERPVLYIDGDMDDDTSAAVAESAEKLTNYDNLSVLLESSGGYIQPPYQMLSTLWRYTKDIEVLVPREAKSAATLFCLGVTTICMGEKGELGPLDAQMPDRSSTGERTSALESFKTLEELRKYSLACFDEVFRFTIGRERRFRRLLPRSLGNSDLTELKKSLIHSMITPLYQQIDPQELGRAARFLSEGEQYAVRVMKRWGYVRIDERDIRNMVRRLVRDYPSHSFLIDLKEADEIGLKAEALDKQSDNLSNSILDTFLKSPDPYPCVELGFPAAE